jgi:hypothetical protein
MRLDCLSLVDTPAPLVPGRPERDWMDAFDIRFPYRCLPLTVANCSGWELLCPAGFEVEWDGGASQGALRVGAGAGGLAESHFGGGVLTFHTGWLFRTAPGWAMWVMGAPNHIKDGIAPLTGLVETDWLPFPFTMNWRMTRPGRVRFAAGEPFAFLTLVEHRRLDEVQPVARPLADDVALAADYAAWRDRRAGFLDRRAAGDPATLKQVWERAYFDGAQAAGHVQKRRLKAPRPPG